jgi:hypothetical protein
MPEVKEPTKEPEVAPDGPTDIKTFTPQKSDAIKDALLNDSELHAKEEAKKKEEEAAAAAAKAADPPAVEKKDDDPDEVFKLPDEDDPFDMDEPMVVTPKEDDEPTPKLEIDELAEKKEGNAGLRQEIKAANEKLEKQREYFESEKARYAEEVEAMKAQLNESNQRLAYRNPDEHPSVLEITKPWDNELSSFVKEMTLVGGNGERLKSLAPELVRNFNALDENDPEYDNRKKQLIGMIDEHFPDDRREVIKLISRGSDILTRANEQVEKVRKGGEEFELGQASDNYDALIDDYTKLEKTYFNPSPDLRESDPLNPKVLLRDLIDSDPRIEEKAKKIKAFVRFAMTPLPPVDVGEIESMDDDQAAQFMQKRTGQHLAAKRKMGTMMAEALMSHAMFPVLSQELAQANKILSTVKSNQPSPAGNDDDPEKKEVEEPQGPQDIKGFKPKRANYKM